MHTWPGSDDSSDLALALRLAEQAGRMALEHLRKGVLAELKPDGSPVTQADVQIERYLREQLAVHRPADAVLGEELGATGTAPRRWILDPIDGTRHFAGGQASWGTHVALEQGGELLVGVITRPMLERTFCATRGGGAFRLEAERSEPQRCRVSERRALGESRVSAWGRSLGALALRLKQRAAWVEPDLDVLLRLAQGELEAVVESAGEIWDRAPAVLLVEEAGGRFSDPHGGRGLDVGGGCYTNGLVHAEFLRVVAE